MRQNAAVDFEKENDAVKVNDVSSIVIIGKTEQDGNTSLAKDNHHKHDHGSMKHKNNKLIVLLSLSAHSLFDGIILGIQNTDNEMWRFLFVVALHHSIMSFSVGNIISTNNKKNSKNLKRHLCMAFIWSIVIPLGIFITIFKASIDKLVVAVLMNVATGSFIYITFIELLPHSMMNFNLPFKLDILFIMLGYAIICIFEYIGK